LRFRICRRFPVSHRHARLPERNGGILHTVHSPQETPSSAAGAPHGQYQSHPGCM
jgi:hypothetical protein